MRIGGESPAYEIVPITPEADGAAPARAKGNPNGGVTFEKALHGIGHAVDRGEALVASAAHGDLGGMDSGQLIALQAGIYRYSEAVDLVGKLVDRAATAVKTVVSPH